MRPDRPALKRILDGVKPGDLLHLEGQTRSLFSEAMTAAKTGKNDADIHSLDVCPPLFPSSTLARPTVVHPAFFQDSDL